jgi:hypothetical protein
MNHDPLDRLRHDPAPPPALQARVVAALERAGLVRQARRHARLTRVAAAAAIFLLGAAGGRLSAALWTAKPPATAPAFLFLLGGDASPVDDASSRAAEYGAWAQRVGARDGSELAAGGRVVAGAAGAHAMQALVDAGGYFIVEAASEREAMALAESCPHVKYGGSIVVRRLQG